MPSKKLSVKIISVTVSLIFLLTSITPSYASSALRPNLIGNKGEEGYRLVTALKGFSRYNFWTFKGLRAAKKAIREKFTRVDEQKEALEVVLSFARELPKVESNLEGLVSWINLTFFVPERVKAARNIEEFKLFINLGIKLAENKINPRVTLQSAIPAVAIVVKNIEELRDACDMLFNLNMKLSENKINPQATLQSAIPAVAIVVKNIEELRDACDMLFNLNMKLSENKIDPQATLESAIPAVAGVAKNIDELKDACDILLNLNIKLGESKINPTQALDIGIPAVAQAIESISSLKKFCISIMPKIVSATHPNLTDTAAQKIFTRKNIARVISLQRTYGDFEVVYHYRPGLVPYKGDDVWGRAYVVVEEKVKIMFSPPRTLGVCQKIKSEWARRTSSRDL